MLTFDRTDGDTLVVRIAGEWTVGNRIPPAGMVEKELSSGSGVRRVAFDATALGGWDSGLLTFLLKVFDRRSRAGSRVDEDQPQGVTATAVAPFSFVWGSSFPSRQPTTLTIRASSSSRRHAPYTGRNAPAWPSISGRHRRCTSYRTYRRRPCRRRGGRWRPRATLLSLHR